MFRRKFFTSLGSCRSQRGVGSLYSGCEGPELECWGLNLSPSQEYSLLTAFQTLCLDFFLIFLYLWELAGIMSHSPSPKVCFDPLILNYLAYFKSTSLWKTAADVTFHRWFYLISVSGSPYEIHLKVYCVLKLSTFLKQLLFKLSQVGISYVFS